MCWTIFAVLSKVTIIEERRAQVKARLMYKSINNLVPERLSSLFQNSNTVYDYDLRGSSTRLYLPKPKTEFLKKKFQLQWRLRLERNSRRDKKFGIV